MRIERPQLRSDLDFTLREDTGDVIVSDGLLDRYHRIGVVERDAFFLFDGQNSLEDIARKLGEMYDAAVSVHEVAGLATHAAELSLLDVTSDESLDGPVGKRACRRLRRFCQQIEESLPSPARRSEADSLIAQSVAHIRGGRVCSASRSALAAREIEPDHPSAERLTKAIHDAAVRARHKSESILFHRIPLLRDPGRLLGAVDWVVGFAIRPATSVVALVGFLLSLGYLIAIADVAFAHLGGLAMSNPLRLGLLIVVSSVIGWVETAMHEIAHGVTCHHFGGKVRQLGLLIVGISVGAYSDVSAAYTFQERWKRIAVSLAGPVHDALNASVFTLVLILTDPGSAWYDAMLVIVVFRVVGTLLSLLPFFKDDFYYALVEWKYVENGFDKSIALVKTVLARRLLGVDIGTPDIAPHELGFVKWYGTLNLVVSGALLVKTLLVAIKFAVHSMKGFGIALVIAVLVLVIGRRVLNLFRYLWTIRGQLVRSTVFLRNLVIGAVLLVVASLIPVPSVWEATGELALEQRPISTHEEGRLVELLIEEGTRVSAGAVIARLDNPQLRAELERCESQRRIAALELETVTRPLSAQERRVLAATARSAKLRASFEGSRRSRLDRMHRRGVVDASQLASAELDAGRSLEGAIRASSQLEKRETVAAEVIAAATAELRALEARCGQLAQRAAALEVIAPTGGTILRRIGERGERAEGRWIATGEELARIALDTPPRVEAQIPSFLADDWQPGAKVEVRVQSSLEQTRNGSVVSTRSKAEGATVEIVMRLDDTFDSARDHAACAILLPIAEEPLFRHFWRTLRPAFQVGFWSLW